MQVRFGSAGLFRLSTYAEGNMKRNRAIVGAAVVLLLAIGAWAFSRADASEASPYRFAEVEQGDLEATVSATGSLGAVTTVEVGTQVSGQVAAIMADFNDRVSKGQLIARIDATLARQSVADAQASLERNRAELDQAEREYERNKQLFEKQVVTESEMNTVEYRLAVARANVKSAQLSVDRARQNLAYTNIYAPIDGIVVERSVDVGQTVSASTSAPQLFLIANDLARLEILASVDESDIGMIQEGQTARFTVQAYPDETFSGSVRQVRLQSSTQENVVNYTVVIEVRNPEGKLLPGMTATVDFLIQTAEDVLMVPNAALRFRPTEEMTAAMMARMQERMANAPDSVREQFAARRGGAAGSQGGDGARETGSGTEGGAQGGQRGAAGGRGGSGFGAGGGGGRGNTARLWYLDDEGQPAVARVRTGVSDGSMTQVQGRDMSAGMQIIVGVTETEGDGGSSNPFQTQQQGRRGPPGTF